MFLSDYHSHTIFSSDAKNTMEEMALAAYNKGFSILCFTDHADDCMQEADLSFTPDKYIEKHGIYDEYLKVRDTLKDKLTLRFGMELSAANQNPEMAKKLINLYPFDFIIGSVHNLTGTNDFYFLSYTDESECHSLMDRYLDEHIEMIKTGGFDVIGHIGYPMKYMARNHIKLDIKDHWDKVKTLLTCAIEKGIGIEVNSSGLRDAISTTIPGYDIIKLYHDLGGEIITTGSDSHTSDVVGYGIYEATELIKEAGFKYVTVFNQRKSEFIKI